MDDRGPGIMQASVPSFLALFSLLVPVIPYPRTRYTWLHVDHFGGPLLDIFCGHVLPMLCAPRLHFFHVLIYP